MINQLLITVKLKVCLLFVLKSHSFFLRKTPATATLQNDQVHFLTG